MATIPIGSFGQAVARPGPLVDIPGGDPLGDAAARTGQIAQNVAIDNLQRETDLQERRRSAEAALNLQRTSNAMHDAHDEVARGVADGSIPVEKAAGEFQKRVGKVRDDALQGYAADDQRMQMQAHLEQVQGALARNLAGTVQKRQQLNAVGSIDSFGEEVSRDAVRIGPAAATQRYASFVKNTAPAAGMDEGTAGRLVQKFREKVHSDFFTQAGAAALQQGDALALRNLQAQIAGPDGEPMDPQRRAVLTHTLFGWEQHVLAQRQRAANQADEAQRVRYNEAVDKYNKALDLTMNGGVYSPEFIKDLTESAAGTELQQPVADLIASQQRVAGFASRSAPERAGITERMRFERNTQGTDPDREKLLAAMERIDGNMRKLADENPWAAAQQAGRIKEAPVFSIANPSSVIQTVQQRMAQIDQVEAYVGKRVSPLQPAEVDQVAKFARTLPLDQAASMLGAMGAAIGNNERAAALAKQLHDKDGTLGLAMMYGLTQTTQGRQMAEIILRGEQALKDDRALVDKAKGTGWRAYISNAIRGAYSSRDAEDAMIEASYLATVALYAENEGAKLDKAIRLATGGIAERNGQKFPLPYGMDEDEFTWRLRHLRAEHFAPQLPADKPQMVYVGRTPLTLQEFVDKLPDVSLVHAGQGVYAVRSGTSLVTNALGQPIRIDMNGPRPSDVPYVVRVRPWGQTSLGIWR